MFALTFLGTSASVPSAERNHSGLLIEAVANGFWWIAERAPNGNCFAAAPAFVGWHGFC